MRIPVLLPKDKKILVACDKFKGSASAKAINSAIATALQASKSYFSVTERALADGGEGTAKVIAEALNGSSEQIEVNGPLGSIVSSEYFILDKKTAAFDMAAASGLALLKDAKRDIMRSSTIGTGQVINHLIQNGYYRIMLGLGGSATCDMGLGALHSLGVRFHNKDGKELVPTPNNFLQIKSADLSSIEKLPADLRITCLCDVNNKLLGPEGTARIFAPQKGALPKDIQNLEKGLNHIVNLLYAKTGKDVSEEIFSGAAGGLGAGLLFIEGTQLISGFSYLSDAISLKRLIAENDLIITGEGCLDDTSLHGKAVGGILKLCQKAEKRVLIVCGKEELSASGKSELPDDCQVLSLLDYADETSSMSNPSEIIRQLINTVIDKKEV